ncbi:MAG TPA: hypothetical protein PKK17_07515, partial [Sphingorhabdus lacus]|nr:hypothetical protein [Sphingorhabdus lacus]
PQASTSCRGNCLSAQGNHACGYSSRRLSGYIPNFKRSAFGRFFYARTPQHHKEKGGSLRPALFSKNKK